MMKIGFVDHNLNNYHADKFHSLLTGEVGAGEIEIVGAYESHGTGKDWCQAHNVPRFDIVEELVRKSDALLVLAPNDIGSHVALAWPVLVSGKPAFLDKTLSDSVDQALEIIEHAQKHSAPLMSSSALRFAVELEELVARIPEDQPVEKVFARGMGPWRRYGVHTIAGAIRLFGGHVKRLIDTGVAGARVVTIDNGRDRALIEVREASNQDEVSPWIFGAMVNGRYEFAKITQYDAFYANLMRQVVQFFKTGKSPVSSAEMLASVAIENSAEESLAAGGQWVNIEL